MRRVGHKHAVAAGKRQIGGERGALVAAFFLHDLDEQHLTAADHVLNLVTAAQRHALRTQRLNRTVVGLRAGALLATARFGRAFRLGFTAFASFDIVFGAAADFYRLAAIFDFLDAIAVEAVIPVIALFVVLIRLGLCGAQCLFLSGMLSLFAQQGFAIFLGDLVIIGVNFAESEEAMAVAAIIDERRLQRWLDAGNLG